MHTQDQDLSPRWAGTTAEQRRDHMRMARLSAAVKAIIRDAPELTEDQRDTLRALLTEGR